MSKILLTDDNSDYRQTVMEILRLEGYTVIEAADGAQALALARIEQPDLVLCDIDMPVMDGFDVLKAIRADPVLQKLPVILVTGRSTSEFIAQGKALGASDHIIKPMSVNLLLRKIRHHLNPDSLPGSGE